MSGLGKFISRAKLPLSGGLVVLLLFVQTLAASSFLHHCFHDDANAPDHVCAVKTVAQGQLDLAAVGKVVPARPEVFLVQFFATPTIPSSDLFAVDSSRGPPSLV
jgi:hypothetical protein